MPYFTDDDSKAVKRIAEIEQQLQDTKREFDRWLAAAGTPTNAVELIQRERDGKTRAVKILERHPTTTRVRYYRW